jgi:hypothetical protein
MFGLPVARGGTGLGVESTLLPGSCEPPWGDHARGDGAAV